MIRLASKQESTFVMISTLTVYCVHTSLNCCSHMIFLFSLDYTDTNKNIFSFLDWMFRRPCGLAKWRACVHFLIPSVRRQQWSRSYESPVDGSFESLKELCGAITFKWKHLPQPSVLFHLWIPNSRETISRQKRKVAFPVSDVTRGRLLIFRLCSDSPWT